MLYNSNENLIRITAEKNMKLKTIKSKMSRCIVMGILGGNVLNPFKENVKIQTILMVKP